MPSLDDELEGGAFALESTADAFNLRFSAICLCQLPFLTADSVAMKGSPAGISSGVIAKFKPLAKTSFSSQDRSLFLLLVITYFIDIFD